MNKIKVTMATVWNGDTTVAQYALNEIIDKSEIDTLKDTIRERYAQAVKQAITVDFVYREMKPQNGSVRLLQ